MAELVNTKVQPRLPIRFQGRTFDARSLVLAFAMTMLLLALIAFLGAMPRGQVDQVETLMLFEVPVHEQEQTAPDVVDQPEQSPFRNDTSSPPAPAPAPAPQAGALDLAVVPVPAIELSRVNVPEVDVSGTASVPAEGAGSQNSGNGSATGTGTGGDGTGGTGAGGNGSGGIGTGGKLFARWAPEMQLSKLDAFFPDAALETGQGGYALVKCFVLKDHSVRDCSLVHEYPAGLGFGAAAVASQTVMRVQVRDRRGKPVFDTWVLYHAEFRHPVTRRRAPKRSAGG